MAAGVIREGWQGLLRQVEHPPCPGSEGAAESPGDAVGDLGQFLLPCHTSLGRGGQPLRVFVTVLAAPMPLQVAQVLEG